MFWKKRLRDMVIYGDWCVCVCVFFSGEILFIVYVDV